MAYSRQYSNHLGPMQRYGGYTGGHAPPGGSFPPGLAPPSSMSSAPGLFPSGPQPASLQNDRASAFPPKFHSSAKMPNIDFNAPVIRLGAAPAKSVSSSIETRDEPTSHDRSGSTGGAGSGRPGLGMDHGNESGSRSGLRESLQMLVPPTSDEKLRTIFLHQIPDGAGGDLGIERLLGAIGKLKIWDAAISGMDDGKESKFGFATFEDADSMATATQLLTQGEVQVPVKRQAVTNVAPPEDDLFEDIEKTTLQASVDASALGYVESQEADCGDQEKGIIRLENARKALSLVIREMFYPPPGSEVVAANHAMTASTEATNNVEVVNIPLTQDDELADIPTEMREIVSGEIAAFRERSSQRDMERLKREEEVEERERQWKGPPSAVRHNSSFMNTNTIPLGPRSSIQNPPSGPKAQSNVTEAVNFVSRSFGTTELSNEAKDEDTDASDGELKRRHESRSQAKMNNIYEETARKWVNRERSRQAALEREQEREQRDIETIDRRRQEQLERDKSWDDEHEANRRTHPYYRDHVTWARKRALERSTEQKCDAVDTGLEVEALRRDGAAVQQDLGLADIFLDKALNIVDRPEQGGHKGDGKAGNTAMSTQQPFKLSFGAAAQKAHASKAGPRRRTIAEVEGLLDDEETDALTHRQLIPIQADMDTADDIATESQGITDSSAPATDEEMTQAVRALAQEIPSDKAELWSWEVKWDFIDERVVSEKLRPFVERKIVEYLGVQEEMLVEAVEDHLRSHGKAAALVEELEGALDDEAEDLVKKLWRMVIFFTECEKRGLAT